MEKQCLAVLENGEECSQFNDKHHALILCSRPPVTDRIFQGVLLTFLSIQIEKKRCCIFHLIINQRNKTSVDSVKPRRTLDLSVSLSLG